ncbi:hypothetical protein [Dolichospermum compactum]|uniref:Type II toxin-antitoxin system PemK/MazF family toxin n=1 Tax=Dolichospermum compactum NIES-806 TaxID=1973481 RepID=A0A1Z4V0Z4_9CYAN|nr:hypothetical protein [Dolichospermum compactum]BAZ84975.1 hypothetical protein NIES806_11750 [Dolichospermum compactum NIES-806]
MKGKVVLIQFPFDDLSSSKVRPAYCLTDVIGIYQHIIFALITSRIPQAPLNTDIILQPEHPDFLNSGLRQWILDIDYQHWGEQLEQDIADGKLEALAEEAIAQSITRLT